MQNSVISTSKFLSLVLRHNPQAIGLSLDPNGWADIAELLERMALHGRPISRAFLEDVVATNDKKRFSISEDGHRIRANQGHSMAVDLGLRSQEPPPLLFHGTTIRHLASIQTHGLLKQGRQQVHLSPDETTATKVGQRHGPPVVLRIAAQHMHQDGYTFYLSANGVWLTDHVPAAYITLKS